MKGLWTISLFASCLCAISVAQMPQRTWESGFSDQYKSENTLGEYTFGYNEDHSTGGSFRRETGDRFGNKMGSYGLRVGDGRVRVINYVADENGFRADVTSNEPGVESQNSNPFSKINKKSIYSVLVPGFRYASESPYVTFQRIYGPASSYEVANQETGHNYESGPQYETGLQYGSEQNNMQGEILGDSHPSQEQDFGDHFSNQREHFDNVYSERDESFGSGFPGGNNGPSNTYTDEEELYDDEYMFDEYKRASEIVPQNQTTGEQMEKGLSSDATSTIASASQNDSQANLRTEETGNNYTGEGKDTNKEDLNLSQSNMSLIKTSDSTGKNDTVVQDKDSKTADSSTLPSTTAKA